MHNFEFVRPTSVADAVSALKGEEAQALAGGQTLLPTMKQRLAMPEILVSLTAIEEIKFVRHDGDTLSIGGGTTHATIVRETASSYPGLSGLASRIGDPAVRNRGTIGGSLANNDPAACYPAALLASGGAVVTNAREIPADEFFQGMFTTALDEGEVITEVKFKVPQASNYQKFEQPASRFPLVGVFVARHSDGVRVGVTGASNDGAFRWSEAEEALWGNFAKEALADLRVDGTNMINDLHGTGEYRAHLVKVMTGRAVAAVS